MTRRTFFSLPAAAAVMAPVQGPEPLYRDYPRCLPDYLRTLAARAYAQRNAELAKLASPSAVRARAQWARNTFWKLAGGEPQSTPLNARTLGAFDRPAYRVEKVVYESRPKFHVPALVYIPKTGRPPFPGILFQMGHSANGKAYDSYQRCCQGLVQLGFVVLAFDPMGQGERVYYPDGSGTRSRLGSPDDEHTVPGKQMLLMGDTCSRLQVWDAVRSLDYLASLPFVDAKRLGSTGQSGGATLTMMLACVDDRLAAAAAMSGNTENIACANYNPPGSTDDAEQNFLNSGPLGFDRWDVLYPMAPKPLLIGVSEKDFLGTYSPSYIDNGIAEFAKLKKAYELMGKPENLAWTSTPLPHGLQYDSRLAVYNFFVRSLGANGAKPVREEPPTSPEPEDALRVSAAGSVVRAFGSETPFTLNRKADRARSGMPLDRLLGVAKPATGMASTVLRRVPSRDGVFIEAVEAASAPRVWLPAWLYLPRRNDASKPVILALEPSGRNARWHEGEPWQALAARGIAVCAADVRGAGDLAPEFGRGNPRYTRPHGDDENYAWASMILGRPLVGQRATDVLALAAALRAHPELKGRKLIVAARGAMAAPATFAAALDAGIAELYLAGPLVSYRSVVETEDYFCPFANFAPNLLLHTDLPEVIASIAPRRVILAGTADGAGRTMADAAVRDVYPGTHIEVRAEAGWDADVFAGL